VPEDAHNDVGRVRVNWCVAAGHEDLDEATAEYLARQRRHAPRAAQVAKRVDFMLWGRKSLVKAVLMRENPVFKCLPYTPLVSRRQRYAILSSALMAGACVSCILYRADCNHIPKASACKPPAYTFPLSMFTWDAVFQSLWGIVLSVPLPRVLVGCFKKPFVLTKQSERHKRLRVSFWLCLERCAWLLVFLVHGAGVFILSQFVRFYPLALFQRFTSALCWQLVHRFATAPGARATWILSILLGSQRCSCCDPCVALNPVIAALPVSAAHVDPPVFLMRGMPPPGPPRARLHWARLQASLLSGRLTATLHEAFADGGPAYLKRHPDTEHQYGDVVNEGHPGHHHHGDGGDMGDMDMGGGD